MFASGTKIVVPTSTLYVSAGDTAAVDYVLGDFTWDNTWRVFDMSGEVPAGAKRARINAVHSSAVGAKLMEFRKNGYSNVINRDVLNTALIGLPAYFDLFVEIDVDRKFEYRGEAAPVLFDVVVKGWEIEVS